MGKVYKFTEDEINDMINMYQNDLVAIYTIADKYGVDSDVIKKRFRDNNIQIAKGSAYSKQYWLDRGLDESKIEEHIKKLRPVNIEYWVKNGYSEDEAILQIEGQKLTSLRGCIARFGEEEGVKKWNEREGDRSRYGKLGSANLEYWMNKGFSKKEAIIKRSERQSTFSLEKCIEKYGEEEGKKRFIERQNKWQKTLYRNGNLKSGYSNISQELFFKLLDSYENINDLNNIFFAKKGGEFVISHESGFYRYDFVDIKNKKIIEYNGDQYHGNPNKFIENDKPHPFNRKITAKELWLKDEIKNVLANKNGFEVLIIWDSEYRLGNKQSVIDKCTKFLNNGIYE